MVTNIDFAENPVLCYGLSVENIFFEEKDDCSSVTFYLKNSIYQQWIEINQY